MNKTGAFFFIVVFLIGCGKTEPVQKEYETIDLRSVLKNPKRDGIFSDARYVKLESRPDILLGNDLHFEIKDDKIYILDRQAQKAVLEFDLNGNFIKKIGKTGRGPEEYVQVIDFLVRNDTIDMLVSTQPNSTIYSYLETGEFVKKTELPIYTYSFQMVKENYAVSINYNKMVSDYQVHLLDKNGEELGKFHPNKTMVDIPLEANCFNICDGRTYYFEPFNNKIFTFTDGILNPFLELDFGDFNVPEEFFQQSIQTGFELINKQGFSLIKDVFENNQFLCFVITRQKEGTSGNIFYIIYNKENREIKYFTIGEEDYLFQIPVDINNQNEIMYLVFPIGNVNERAKKFGLNLDITELEETDNPVLMFCKIN